MSVARFVRRLRGGRLDDAADDPSRRGGELAVDVLSAGYGKVPALHDISLRVGAGESVALLGANGAGKTTFLRAVSGLLKPSAGRVRFDGADLTGARPHEILRRGIAHVPQGRQVFASQSVHENLLLGARLRRDKVAVERDLAYLMEVFPVLSEKLKQPAGNLSGGQQQALATARALISDPTLLLLDEPSLGLAPRLVDDLGQMLRTVQRDRGMGMLLVEQDTLLALELTERAYVIQRGQIILERPSASLAKDPSIIFAYLGGERPSDSGSPQGHAPTVTDP